MVPVCNFNKWGSGLKSSSVQAILIPCSDRTVYSDNCMPESESTFDSICRKCRRGRLGIDDPLPDVVTFPGLRVSTQIPEGGREFNTTLPVARIQVGWVMFPITGADGVAGCAFITAFDDGAEVQPVEFVTVKVYVPGDIPEITVDNVLPKTVLPPGLIVTVHDPAGNPFRVTLPVASAQVGWVINPTTGAEGAEGAAGIVTLDEGDDVHPPWFVTV
jgi:hypothetical protein